MDGHSDWEYYSDDYYDDDPKLLRTNPQGGSPSHNRHFKKLNGAQRGKKRKLAATSDIPDLCLDEDLKHDLKAMRPPVEGTVWRSASSDGETKKLYEPGRGERVALLENWREVFTAQQLFGRKGSKGPWRSRKAVGEHNKASARSSSVEKRSAPNARVNGSSEGLELAEDQLAAPRRHKRRRISFGESPQFPHNEKIVVEIPLQRVNGLRKDEHENQSVTVQRVSSSMKRKANDIDNEKAGEGSVEPRAKRVVSGKAPSKIKEAKKAPPLPTARTTRSRKK
jgi:hypothetical protein